MNDTRMCSVDFPPDDVSAARPNITVAEVLAWKSVTILKPSPVTIR